MNSGPPNTNPSSGREEDLNPGPPDYKSSALPLGQARLLITKRHLGYLPFTRANRKFQLENQMVRAIPFEKLQKIWAVIRGDAIFLLFEVSLADVDIFYNNSLFPESRI